MFVLNGFVWLWFVGLGGWLLRVFVCLGGNGVICKYWYCFVDLCLMSVR